MFFNMKRARITSTLTLIVSILTLFACFEGVFNKNIYDDLLEVGTITKLLHVGSVGQDIIFIPLAFILMLLSIIFLFRPGLKTFIIIIGMTGNFLYGYGLYAMQGEYTSIYLMYLAIFSLSIYSVIFGLLSFTPEDASLKTSIPKALRISISVFLFFIAFMLGFIWIMRISADIARHIPQDTYGVFVLDLGIVFPFMGITATKLIKNKPFGNILAGIALVKASTICLSWGFAEWFGRFKGVLEGSYDMLIIPVVLMFISLIFFVLYLGKIKKISNDM